jgi:hypothetical protein
MSSLSENFTGIYTIFYITVYLGSGRAVSILLLSNPSMYIHTVRTLYSYNRTLPAPAPDVFSWVMVMGVIVEANTLLV